MYGLGARSRGFTLTEVTMVTAVVGVLTLLITQALADLWRSQAYTRGQARLGELSDRVIRNVANDLAFATRVFTDGAHGDAWLSVLAWPATAVAPDSRLPALTGRGYFDVDPPAELETGNLLLVGRFAGPVHVEIPVAIGSGSGSGSGGLLSGVGGLLGSLGGRSSGGESPATRTLRIDTHRLVIYYLTRVANGELDLARWGSVPLASRGDIEAIPDAQGQTDALVRLHAAGIRFAWDARAGSTELRRITAAGAMVALEPGQKVTGDPAQAVTGVAEVRNCRVAANGEIGKIHVPRYAIAGSGGFPGGFEVKVDGPATGKLVLVRLVLRSGPGGSSDNGAEAVRLVSCRDG